MPGCIYYGDAGRHGKVMFVTDKRQSNRYACLAMRPKGRRREGHDGGFPARRPATSAASGDAAPAPPESLDVILGELDHIRLPWNDLLPRLYGGGRRRNESISAARTTSAGIRSPPPTAPTSWIG